MCWEHPQTQQLITEADSYMMKKLITFFTKHKWFLVFTLIYFALGLFLYKDFGATFDEKTEYDAGKYLRTYYKTPTLGDYVLSLVQFNPKRVSHRQIPLFSDYSRVYPMLVTFLNPSYYLEWFHLQNIFLGYFLFLFSYALFYLFYKKSTVATLGALLLFLTPRITGHIPANPKDIPFATIMLLGALGIYFFCTYLPKQTTRKDVHLLLEILVLGGIFGTAQSLRTVGLTLPLVYFTYNLILLKSSKETPLVFLKTITIGLVSLVIWVISVPFVGANLFANIISVLSNAANFQAWDFEVLYFGKFLYKDQRPWHYLFVYLLIQLPLFTLFGLSLGISSTITKTTKWKKAHPAILLIMLIAINVVLYLLIHPVVYNGIRHFLYLIVFLTTLAGFILFDLYQTWHIKTKTLAKILIGGYCLFTLLRMSHLHPYEYIYYNELMGGLKGAQDNFELDYWGTAYKEATEYVGEKAIANNLENLGVYTCDIHFAVEYFAQLRFKRISASKDSDVIICDTFKVRLREATGQSSYTQTHPLVKTITREGVAIHNIYARPHLTQYFLKN